MALCDIAYTYLTQWNRTITDHSVIKTSLELRLQCTCLMSILLKTNSELRPLWSWQYVVRIFLVFHGAIMWLVPFQAKIEHVECKSIHVRLLLQNITANNTRCHCYYEISPTLHHLL